MASMQIHVAGATKIYANGVRALEAVDLDVDPGEFITLLGPSGCGKSTLLRMIAGLTPPSAGRIEVSADVAKADVAFVFQQPTLMPWASVHTNVRLPLDLRGRAGEQADARVSDALSLLGLHDFAGAWPRELSGGMQMRVSIARALVTRPRLLLMDEPFAALDEITRNRLDRDLLQLWCAQALTVVFVTHSIYEAVFLSTRVVVMSQRPGRVIGEVRIDEPEPRGDDFRLSDRFTRHCRLVAELLARGSGARDAKA